MTTKQKQKNKLSIRFRSHPSDAAEDEVTVFGCDPKERKFISERRSKNKTFTLYSEGATMEVTSNRVTTRATNGIGVSHPNKNIIQQCEVWLQMGSNYLTI